MPYSDVQDATSISINDQVEPCIIIDMVSSSELAEVPMLSWQDFLRWKQQQLLKAPISARAPEPTQPVTSDVHTVSERHTDTSPFHSSSR